MTTLRFLVAILLLSFSLQAQNSALIRRQNTDKFKASMKQMQYQRGQQMGGIGLTFLGLSAKYGAFAAKNWWWGAEVETHILLSNRIEAGIFTRYYGTRGGVVSTFAETGISYGKFSKWNFKPNPDSPVPYNGQSFKLNGAIGMEIHCSKLIGLEGVMKVGRLTETNWWQPSFQASVNCHVGR